jgi:hypothetical protein
MLPTVYMAEDVAKERNTQLRMLNPSLNLFLFAKNYQSQQIASWTDDRMLISTQIYARAKHSALFLVNG